MSPQQELVRQWLQKVVLDLRGARLALTADPPLCESVCFQSQQAVEKGLKAFLVYKDVEFEWTHRIRYLLDVCVKHDTAFEQWYDEAEPLTSYAVEFRYPHPIPPPTVSESEIALDVAQRLYEFVLQRLPEETHPA